jgi:hypothetical protein
MATVKSLTVIVAEPLLVGSSTEVAVMVTGPGGEGGSVDAGAV